MIGPVVCSQWPPCHQFVTRQPQSSHQSNRHTTQRTEQMSRCLNQSRQASHPPLIKLASHLSRSELWPYWDKGNDSRLPQLVADGPGRLELELLFSLPKKMNKYTAEILIPFPLCWHVTTFKSPSFLWVSFFPSTVFFSILQYTRESHE